MQRNPNIPRAQALCSQTARATRLKVKGVQFGLLSPREVQKLSVAEIKIERPYDDDGNPAFGGLSDPRMGTATSDYNCVTCKGSIDQCPGHFGHITLAKKVYHVGLLNQTVKILRVVCFYCSKLLVARDPSSDDARLLSSHRLSGKAKMNYIVSLLSSKQEVMCDPKTGGCGHLQPKVMREGLSIKVQLKEEGQDPTKDSCQNLLADDAHKVLSQIPDRDLMMMGLDSKYGRPEWMILEHLAVAPPCVRPSVLMPNGSGYRSEDDLTYAYAQIIKTNNLLLKQVEVGASLTALREMIELLQFLCATLIDNDLPPSLGGKQKHKSSHRPLKSLRTRLKGKEGRVRGNLMGKRVDYSSRTVITPDPSLELDQLGVPQEIAKHLTYPEMVTKENQEWLKVLIQNGPTSWPGARYIIRPDKRMVDLTCLRNRSDAHIQPGYIVERHIRDGDFVAFNRQPSLHKMSLMGHRIKVLPHRTFRMNLSVTSPYNADFDGDEMNMHVPQSLESVAEIREIMHVPKQILNPQSNKPIMGVVQDSLLGCMLFTKRDTFLRQEDMMNLVSWIENPPQLPKPAIIKPVPLWTGKQIFSLLLPCIRYVKRTSGEPWDSSNDLNVLVSHGELLCGQATKAQVGTTGSGIVQIICKEHGSKICADFITQVQYVVNNWLVLHGFTVGVSDIIAESSIMKTIRETLSVQLQEVTSLTTHLNLDGQKKQPGKTMLQSLEIEANKILNDARDRSGKIALDNLSNKNRLRNMVKAGSKGNDINISQIMACVGQQNVEGQRIKYGFNKRTLPHFTKDDMGPASRGFVSNSYFLGLSPSELFFHAMGGREGLIDTAVKTAETGYISRRLMKALEDLMIKYDGTVRTAKNQVVQYTYGEDGLAGEWMEGITLDILQMDNDQMNTRFNFHAHQPEEVEKHFKDPVVATDIFEDPLVAKALEEEMRSLKKDRESLRNSIYKLTNNDFAHLPVNLLRVVQNAKLQFEKSMKTDLKPTEVIEMVKQTLSEICVIPAIKQFPEDPDLREANFNSYALFAVYLRSFLSSKNVIMHHKLTRDSLDFVLNEVKERYGRCLAPPGEMVGSLAAQALGEPATQMTLNTFHFAGVSSKNVTLGVPRLKEIINVSKNIKTPSLKIYLDPHREWHLNEVIMMSSNLEHTTLGHMVTDWQLFYDPDPKKTVIKADEELVKLYSDFNATTEEEVQQQRSPWIIRLVLDRQKLATKNLSLQAIDTFISRTFNGHVSIMHTDENSTQQVMRLRLQEVDDEEQEPAVEYLQKFTQALLSDMAIKGLPEIKGVSYQMIDQFEFDKKTGKRVKLPDRWMIETDGVALQKILGFKRVDKKMTISNDCLEVRQVLGIEAARQSIVNEFRMVLANYGIYVNYRHLSILTETMTMRGNLMSIARHGMNRINSGALRKASFEETVEILLEASAYSERDTLDGITENIMLGQLAPMGTGAFDLTIDNPKIEQLAPAPVLNDEFAQMEWLDEDKVSGASEGGMTPVICDTPQLLDEVADASMTPLGGGATSIYATSARGGMTPFNQGGFSPADCMRSPDYSSPVHNIGSPSLGRPSSPIYYDPMWSKRVNNVASPAYGGGRPYSTTSPQYAAGSPNGYPRAYSPAQSIHSGIPITPGGQYPSTSPAYQQQQTSAYGVPQATSNRSPVPGSGAYSPHDLLAMAQSSPIKSGYQASPAYSPGGTERPKSLYPQSPAYQKGLN